MALGNENSEFSRFCNQEVFLFWLVQTGWRLKPQLYLQKQQPKFTAA